MSVQGINTTAPLTTPSAGGRLYLSGAKEFSQTLNIGQIIQCKVLRQFDGTRYLVTFGEHERVVDSAIPLTAGEVLHGRVIGLGDRVELQRVPGEVHPSTPVQEQSVATIAREWLSNSDAKTIAELLQRYQVNLTTAERASLIRASRSVEDTEALGLAGAVLSKLGLAVSSPLLEAVYSAQFTKPVKPPLQGNAPEQTVPQVSAVWEQAAQTTAASIRDLAEGLNQIMKARERQLPAAKNAVATREQSVSTTPQSTTVQPDIKPTDERDAHDRSMEELANWILNAQTGGTVSHQLGVLPLILGGRLVEVNVAMFEQQRDSHPNQRLQHRQVMFSLSTEHLGQVQVLARVAGEHVRIQITTTESDRTLQAAQHASVLKDALTQGAWTVDEISYETRANEPHNGVVRSVIEHVVSQDSLNRFI